MTPQQATDIARKLVRKWYEDEAATHAELTIAVAKALHSAHAASYRAGLEAAAGVAEAYGKIELPGEDASTVRFVAASRQDALVSAIRALPVPGEAPAPSPHAICGTCGTVRERHGSGGLGHDFNETPPPVRAPAAPPAEAPDLRGLLADCVGIVDKAGLLNLSNGVQLGQTVWYVHASDIFNRARAALAAQPEGQAALAQEPGPDDGRDTSGGARRKPGPAAASGSSGGNVAHAAAPGGEDAEALLRECEEALRYALGRSASDMAVILDRLAARAGGSR